MTGINLSIKIKWFIFLIVLLFSSYSFNFARTEPMEQIRAMSSDINAFYFPSLGSGSLPYFNNFSISGKWINLFPKGNNLNFYYGYNHSVANSVILPSDAAELTNYRYTPQSLDNMFGSVNFAFLDYFQLSGRVDYTVNRIVAANSFQDYNYNMTSYTFNFIYDWKYSSLEDWYKGMVFIYPEEGFYVSLGSSYNQVQNSITLGNDNFTKVNGEIQQLFHFMNYWTLSFDLSCDAHLKPSPNRAYYTLTKVVGAYQIPGDYMADGAFELRFLHPSGLFWESPEFWYIASFLFKFSPGFIIGYNGGLAGRYGLGKPDYLQSFYVSPIVAVRVSGTLVSVLRLDIALGSSKTYNYVVSLNFGTAIGQKPVSVFQQGER